MKKLIAAVALIILASSAAAFAINPFLKYATDKGLDYLTKKIKVPALEFSRPYYSRVWVSSPSTITWSGILVNGRMIRNAQNGVYDDIALYIGRLTVRLKDPIRSVFEITARDLRAAAIKRDSGNGNGAEATPEVELSAKKIGAAIRTNLFSKADIIKNIDELKNFLLTGETGIPVEFSARQTVMLKGRAYPIDVWVEKTGDRYRVLADPGSLGKISELLCGIRPTEKDIRLIARNPMKIPVMMKIRAHAYTAAERAHAKNPAVPKDAYRHILWSYLLVRAFGDEFAKEVCDAHEAYYDNEELLVKDRGSLARARRQDIVNNSIGRKYAEAGYKESEILRRMMADPGVMRD